MINKSIFKYVVLASLVLASGEVFAQKKTKTNKNAAKTTQKNVEQPVVQTQASGQLAQALRLVQSGQYQQAIPVLYSLSRKAEFQKEQMQIKYILGSSLMEVGLNQIAAFQFVEVIKNGNSKYVKQAIEKLSLAADALGDDTLLNYAVTKIKMNEIPTNGRDLITYRLGEIKMKNGQFAQAIEIFNQIPESSRYFFNAKYNKGLALLEQNKATEAVNHFKALVAYKAKADVTDTNRVIAQLGLARAYYQASDWENSLAAYREIPRDHFIWHESLFESTWAALRAARFRTSLSNLQSLHSAFYEENYIPESLLLRAIVYLYICKYDEMDKVLELFERSYGNVRTKIGDFLNANSDPQAYYNEIAAAHANRMGNKGMKFKLPLKVSYNILSEGDIKRAFGYLHALNNEKAKLDSMPSISKSAIGSIAKKILANRYKNAQIAIGEKVKLHLVTMRVELKDLYEQASFVRYEMINGKKEQLKKKIAGKDIPTTINDKVDRSVYVQNGYEYWPFDGEYWLDEIGSYHYLGKQNCE